MFWNCGRIFQRTPIQHNLYFRNEFYKNDTELSTELWQIKMKNNILEITWRVITKEISCKHCFVIKLKRVKILDFISSGCVLYIKISRIVWNSLLTTMFVVYITIKKSLFLKVLKFTNQ